MLDERVRAVLERLEAEDADELMLFARGTNVLYRPIKVVIVAPYDYIYYRTSGKAGIEKEAQGGTMEILRRADNLILDVLRSNANALTCEEITARIPELTWNQVFLSIDAMSRSGEVILHRCGSEYQATVAGDSDA